MHRIIFLDYIVWLVLDMKSRFDDDANAGLANHWAPNVQMTAFI